MGDCKPSEDLLAAFKKLRFSRANYSSALLLKVDKAKNSLEVDEKFEETSLESVAQELEEGNPRFIIYSFKWDRGDRVQFPLILIYYNPEGASPTMNMMYSRSYDIIRKQLDGVQRSFDIRDSEELSDNWLLNKLQKA